MVAVNTSLFRGMSEKISPRLLPEDMATLTINVDLDYGSLRPIRGWLNTSINFTGGIAGGGVPNTIWQSNTGRWYAFAGAKRSLINSPVAEDVHARVYLSTVDSAPQITTNAAPFIFKNLGLEVPPPLFITTPSVSPATSTKEDTEVAQSRSYVATYLTPFGEEGPPSQPTPIVEVRSDQSVRVSTGSSNPAAVSRNVSLCRIYRTDSSGVFRFVAQRSTLSGVSVDDTVLDSELGEELVTQEYLAPPNTMQGLCSMTNGISAGFVGQTVCFSEAFQPHAWPTRYQLTTQEAIKAILPLETGLLIMTEGNPYIAQGADPSGMVMSQLNVPYPIANPESAVNIGGSVIYSSKDGLVQVSSTGASLVTEQTFSSEQWNAATSPDTTKGFLYEGKYIGAHATVGAANGFIYDPRGGKSAFTKTSAGVARTGFTSPQDNALYIVKNAGNYAKFGEGAYLAAHWQSRHYYSPRAINLGVIEISFGLDLGGGSTAVVLYAGDNLDESAAADAKSIKVILPTEQVAVYRLPSGYKEHVFEITIVGSREIHSITIAESPAEL